jgi:hypothetical protein
VVSDQTGQPTWARDLSEFTFRAMASGAMGFIGSVVKLNQAATNPQYSLAENEPSPCFASRDIIQ